MTRTLSDSRLSNLGAARILEGFEDHTRRFGALNKRAARRFADADWGGAQNDAVDRLEVYPTMVSSVVTDLGSMLQDRLDDPILWVAIKAVYSGLIAGRQDWELAETFYNSITRRVFETIGVDERAEFVDTDFDSPPTVSVESVYLTFEQPESITALVTAILSTFAHEAPYLRLDLDAAAVADRIEKRLHDSGGLPVVGRAEILRTVFYRGQAAYLVGLLYAGSQRIPLIIALRHQSGGIIVDAVLLTENEVSILFSFTRAYFSIDTPRPYDVVRFLGRLMPRKRVAELYISIGQNKHGKTELYRDLLRHLRATTERFESAPGTPGLVMVVFTMPGYDDVFKVIRDKFPFPKRATRSSVMAKYRLVFQHDRGGRLMDAQDFQHLEFDRSRFEPGLLDELLMEAARTVELDGDAVIIKQVYVERRITPLDLYVRDAVAPAAEAAALDYGQAIKDLASTNIFPGDLLIKNFGVTRHGRVVFYDYDELSTLTDVRFKTLPTPRDDDEAMAAEPWFSVNDTDVYPEEHRSFLGMRDELRRRFEEQHADLFDPAAWQRIQKRIRNGELIEVFPYTDAARLAGTEDPRGW